jgi:hypothetical protein
LTRRERRHPPPQTGGRDVRRVKAPFDPASESPREGSGAGGDRPDQGPAAPRRVGRPGEQYVRLRIRVEGDPGPAAPGGGGDQRPRLDAAPLAVQFQGRMVPTAELVGLPESALPERIAARGGRTATGPADQGGG